MPAIRISADAFGLALLAAGAAADSGAAPVPTRLAPANTGLFAGQFRLAERLAALAGGSRPRAETPAR